MKGSGWLGLFNFAVVFLLMAGTVEAGCDKYVGHWVDPNKHVDDVWEFTIHKDGNQFLFDGNLNGFLGPHYKAAIECERDRLTMRGVPMVGKAPLTLIYPGKSIVFNGNSFNKKVDVSSKEVLNQFEKILKVSLTKKLWEGQHPQSQDVTFEYRKFIIEDAVRPKAEYGSDSWVPRGYTIIRLNWVTDTKKEYIDFEYWFEGLFSVDNDGKVQEISPPGLFMKDDPKRYASNISPADAGELMLGSK